MPPTPFTAVGTASAILTLSKTAWRVGICLSRLDQEPKIVDITVKNLAGEVKSLGNECDLVYAELEEVVSKSETGSIPPFIDNVDGRIWNCIAAQVEEASGTLRELELLVRSVRGEESSFNRQKKLDSSKDHIENIRTRICRHTDNLRTTLLLIKTVFTHITPSRANQALAQELDKLQDLIEKLQRSSEANPQSLPSHIEATLMQCVREAIAKGTSLSEARVANSNIRVSEWVSALDSIRRDQRHSYPSDIPSNVSTSQDDVYEHKDVNLVLDDSEDDLDTDLAKAALHTGTSAFESQEWEEADSLLQEALRGLQQLSRNQREFCDIFGLQYRLAVCAYHIQEPTDAEEALMSVVQQSASSDEQRRYIYDAAHLLSYLYIRMGEVERARSECEKVLQARRRLLGKRSDAALESTALMAHIYFLLNNCARAKAYLAMIPEARRDAVVNIVQGSLDTRVNIEHLDSSSLRTQSISEDSNLAVEHIQSRLSASTMALPMENYHHGPISTTISQSPAASPQLSHQPIFTSANERSKPIATQRESVNEDYSSDLGALDVTVLSPGTLSRKEILDKIGCQPKDAIEDAVCEADHAAFASLLNRKKDFWRSMLRKRVHPERVTALHFAALFGEIDMARRLLGSNFNVNEVPYGYTTSLSPLHFAIGARQVNMVEFLIANGARPSKPDSWSTLAGQLMNRSWLMKTMSESEKKYVPSRIIAILSILLHHGWDINSSFEPSGGTLLHQAVTFWTGSYRWDLNLRATMTSFLCRHGANPSQPNAQGKTPYDLALASGHQDLLLILNRDSKNNQPDHGSVEPVELSSEPT